MKLALVLIVLLSTVLAAQAPQEKPSVVPAPPQLTSDALFALQGRCVADRDLQSQYITQLQQKIVALSQELEDLKKTSAKPTDAKKGQ